MGDFAFPGDIWQWSGDSATGKWVEARDVAKSPRIYTGQSSKTKAVRSKMSIMLILRNLTVKNLRNKVGGG